MTLAIVRRGLPLAAAAILLMTGAVTAWAQNGRLAGTVTDIATTAPLENARILVSGTSLIETTNGEGRYNIRSIAPGTYQVRALRIGYAPLVQTVTIGQDETGALDFALTRGTGAARRDRDHRDGRAAQARDRQRGLDHRRRLDSQAEQPITEFGNLISGRAAGVQVLKSGGTTGTGTRIRIRGSNSVSLSNEPLYYIDGIRMESSALLQHARHRRLRRGRPANSGPSRINDINPDDIESIEIVKGPAAATLYGIQASNGVVRITTKHGQAGPAPLEPLQRGRAASATTIPIRSTTTGATVRRDRPRLRRFLHPCSSSSTGDCTQTSVDKYSPLERPVHPPAQDRASPAVRRQRVRRQRRRHLLSSRPDTRTRTACSGCRKFEEDSVRGAGRNSCPTTRSGPTRWSG